MTTIIEGNVTARRVTTPRPVALKLRDDVLVRDTITTAERSLARLLLGGKATVTVRERSQLTVNEVPGTSTVGVGKGKIGLALVPDRIRPGSLVEIRTPNTVVSVRGTVLVTEILPGPTRAALAAPAIKTNVYVLSGKVDVQELRGGVPVGPVFSVKSRQMITIPPPGSSPVTSFPESRIPAITAGLHPASKGLGRSSTTAAKEAALRAAASDLAEAAVGGEERLPADGPFVRAPIVPARPAPPDSPAAAPAPAPALARPPAQVTPPPPPTNVPPGRLR
ncbi:MAG: FecR domain-containing protein [Candidatus Rokuibacteriota bacterium]